MLFLLKRFEQAIIIALAIMMGLVVTVSTFDLAKIIVLQLFENEFMILEVELLLDMFGLFLLVLIGLELLEIIKSYAIDDTNHVQVVLTVAMIAVARKVIILDVNERSTASMLGIGAIIVALSVAHFVLNRDRQAKKTAASS